MITTGRFLSAMLKTAPVRVQRFDLEAMRKAGACCGAFGQATAGRGLLLAGYGWPEVAADVLELATIGRDGLARSGSCCS